MTRLIKICLAWLSFTIAVINSIVAGVYWGTQHLRSTDGAAATLLEYCLTLILLTAAWLGWWLLLPKSTIGKEPQP